VPHLRVIRGEPENAQEDALGFDVVTVLLQQDVAELHPARAGWVLAILIIQDFALALRLLRWRSHSQPG
jgi:hypothetical protein